MNYTKFIVSHHYEESGYTRFFLKKKKGILISYQSRSVVCLCGCASVMFLVNVSPLKWLDVAASNFVAE